MKNITPKTRNTFLLVSGILALVLLIIIIVYTSVQWLHGNNNAALSQESFMLLCAILLLGFIAACLIFAKANRSRKTHDEITNYYVRLQKSLGMEAVQETEDPSPDKNILTPKTIIPFMPSISEKDSTGPVVTSDILALMTNNMSEMQKYYTISRNQAQDAFVFAVFMSLMGLFIIFGAVISLVYSGLDMTAASITAVGGTIVELIAGTALIVYRKTLDQLNLYYNSLHENERFLSIVHLVGKITPANRDNAYLEIIKAQFKMFGAALPTTDPAPAAPTTNTAPAAENPATPAAAPDAAAGAAGAAADPKTKSVGSSKK